MLNKLAQEDVTKYIDMNVFVDQFNSDLICQIYKTPNINSM